MFDMHEVIFEVYIQDTLAQRQIMQAPKGILIAHFVHMAQMIQNDQRPMCIKMIRPEVIWDPFEETQKTINNEIVLSNNAMTAEKEDEE
jgi:hypothetical protein